jgi:hypothetical protein
MSTQIVTTLAALAVVMAWAAPGVADHNRHVGADGVLRAPQAAADPAVDLDVRIDRRGFRVGGRVRGLERPYGGSLGGEIDDRGLTLDGRLEGGQPWRLRVDAETLEGAARDVSVAARQLARDLAQRYLTRP